MRRCKCGQVCAYYGAVGGYSVLCAECNAKAAAGQRRRRKERKAPSLRMGTDATNVVK